MHILSLQRTSFLDGTQGCHTQSSQTHFCTSVKGQGGWVDPPRMAPARGFRLEGYKEEMHSISYMWGETRHLLYIQVTCSNALPENRVHLFPQLEGLCLREHILDVHLGLEVPFVLLIRTTNCLMTKTSFSCFKKKILIWVLSICYSTWTTVGMNWFLNVLIFNKGV